ncbi:hypothetical protein VUJ46_10205 [Chryseobacterium sp. MYb264]|uniref:hypothetical protein n=1 Tax=Chryseobacterium sp. MYb264 TaxID=2745153 RepID=UPI002E142828|nr:hypothetical protein VUJ46_10205 [Chryseobacterium sp. MYb264]
MKNKICEISISKDWLVDTYIFYENQTIKRVFADNSLNHKLTRWLEPKQISKTIKDQLIRKCPEELKEKIMLILDYP